MKKKISEPAAEYLNVDLEIRSRSDLTPLADELSRSLFLLHAGRIPRTFLASFETGGGTQPPDRAIKRLAAAVSRLPPPTRKLLRAAGSRAFDIGVAAKSSGRDVLTLSIKPETLKAIAQLDAHLALTFYPPDGRLRQKPPRTNAPSSKERKSSPKPSPRARVQREP